MTDTDELREFNAYVDRLVDEDPDQLRLIAKGLEADGRAAREALAETKAELDELRSAARAVTQWLALSPRETHDVPVVTRLSALLGAEDTQEATP